MRRLGFCPQSSEFSASAADAIAGEEEKDRPAEDHPWCRPFKKNR
jgi:hypothetical protein